MYATLLTLHSIFRWLVLFSLLTSILIAARAYFNKAHFTYSINKVRHWTATIAHVQLLLGILLYVKSPLVSFYFSEDPVDKSQGALSFFALYHASCMLLSIVLITIGSAKAKRQAADQAKFKTMLIFYSLALLLILIAIPWPFSPFANRPLLRSF